jgi:predicted methyltransferase
MSRTIYTGVFFEDGTHMTISFRPSDDEVSSTPVGEEVEVRIIGRRTTSEVDVYIVDTDIEVSSGVPHITISTSEGVSPVRSIEVIRMHGYESIEPFTMTGRVGRFIGRTTVFD